MIFALSANRAPDAFYVQVAYADAGGGQLRRTELAVRAHEGVYRVVGFALYRGADGELIIASGEGWDLGLGNAIG